jgi:hypothetical protein
MSLYISTSTRTEKLAASYIRISDEAAGNIEKGTVTEAG